MESMLDTLTTIWDKEREDMNGLMVKCLKEIGRKAKRMAMVYGNLQTEIAMWVTGLMAVSMELELIHTKTASIRVNLLIVWSMDSVNNLLQTAINLRAIITMGNLKEKENMNGLMEVTTKDSLRVDIGTDKEYWNRLMALLTKVISYLP
jgi:hypothetical protein